VKSLASFVRGLTALAALATVTFAAAIAPEGEALAKPAAESADPLRLQVPGHDDAFYYRPKSKAQKPILMYLHGRGGHPMEDCRKWAKVASEFGWVICPQGPIGHDAGGRQWGGIDASKQAIDAAVGALRAKYKTRVKTRGNVLIGFSEGAFVAQQVGVHDPDKWNRWLILAANDRYWFGDAPQLLVEHKKKIRRVFLFTGENDQVVQNTLRAGEMLKKESIPVRVQVQPGMGHEVPADRMVLNYRRPLRWLISAK
jgi:predicted esterase